MQIQYVYTCVKRPRNFSVSFGWSPNNRILYVSPKFSSDTQEIAWPEMVTGCGVVRLKAPQENRFNWRRGKPENWPIRSSRRLI